MARISNGFSVLLVGNRTTLRCCRRQRGLALVTMLLALALVTTIAATMIENQFLTIRRAENLQLSSQAWEYAIEAEKWASRKIARDGVKNDYDYLGDDWNKLGQAIKVENGAIKVDVVDMQSKFNLNNFPEGKKNKIWYPAFQRLLIALKLDKNLANVVADWVDQDSNVSFPKGAEDYDYLGGNPPYRAANRAFEQVGELRKLKGFDARTFDTLEPYVTALPPGAKININTCDPLLIRVLAPGRTLLPASDADKLVSGRGKDGYKNIQAFLDKPELSGNRNAIAAPLVTVSSDYFSIKSQATSGRMKVNLVSTVQRETQQNKIGIRLMSRYQVLR